MENNKILISARFLQERETDDASIELMILRDATFGELLESIEYGLEKRAKLEEKRNVDSSVSLKKCKKLFDKCKQTNIDDNGKEYWPLIGLSIYDSTTLKKNVAEGIVKIKDKRVCLYKSACDKKLCDLGIISATAIVFFEFESLAANGTTELRIDQVPKEFKRGVKTEEIDFPKYNINSRQLTSYDTTPVEIIPPQAPPQKPKQNLVAMLLPSVLSIAMMLLMQSLMSKGQGGSGSWALMSVGMGAASIIVTFLSWHRQIREHEIKLEEWKVDYKNYITRVISGIKSRQENDISLLSADYPDYKTLTESAYKLEGDLFNRSPANADFLTVSLGRSDQVPNVFKIEGKAKDEVFSPAYFTLRYDEVDIYISDKKSKEIDALKEPGYNLANLPAKIAEEYRYMSNAPYIYSFKNTGTLGVVCHGRSKAFESVGDRFIRSLVYKLCYHHSPENLQFVIFFPETVSSKEIYDRLALYLYLPHCRELLENKSQFVFSRIAANSVLSSMLKIMEGRSNASEKTAAEPHIIFIVFDEYDLKEHAFAKYLPTAPAGGGEYCNELGLSFIFVKDYQQYLPEYCTDIISFGTSAGGAENREGQRLSQETATIVSYNNKNKKVEVVCDVVPAQRANSKENWEMQRDAFYFLSSMYYTRISQNRQVPSNVSLFDLWKIDSVNIKKCIEANWGFVEEDGKKSRRFDITKTLAVPIGDTGGKEPTFLDLHERSDGPHMLVAGTTGSGKSETILAYLIGLCMRFRPDEVNLMLVDMKGGGFTKRLKALPHVVGKVTDIDGDENNTGSEYMLKRFLVAIKDEIKYRKLVINHFDGVDSIDGYIKKCRKITSDVKSSEEDRKYVKEHSMGHLILVIDEFTELKRFSSQSGSIDYMGEITTIARIGRSLGIHIILISQNIEGAINDDIRVNSKSRLCLKVATRQASNEMLGNALAAAPSMPGNGRAYLLVGTGSKFEYFQSAYSGASSKENTAADLSVTYVKNEGDYECFYHAYEDNAKIVRERDKGSETQLEVAVKAVCSCYEDIKDEVYVRNIFRDPLPSRVVYQNDEDQNNG